jgi:hypothetical protein
MTAHRCLFLVLFVLTAGLVACSSQNDTISTPVVRPPSVAPAGIYEGTWTSTATGDSTAVTAFLDSDETMMVFDADGALIASGVYATIEDARSISWTARVFEPVTSTDETTGETTTGTAITTLTAGGSYAEQASLLLTFTRSTGETGTLALNYDETAYESRSDVSLIQGSWGTKDAYGAATISLSVDAGGGFSGTDENNCSYSGRFSIITQQYNLYGVTLTSSCPGAATSSTTTGLATLKAATSTSAKTLISVSTAQKAAVLLKLKPL